VFEVAELEVGVMLGYSVHILERKMVGALVGHADRLPGGRVGARVAVVFHVALAALQLGVIAIQQRDLARVAAHTHVFDFDLGAAVVLVPQGVLLRPGQRLDQPVAHDARPRGVRIMAKMTIGCVLHLPRHLDHFG